jgi:hypothetical protein
VVLDSRNAARGASEEDALVGYVQILTAARVDGRPG